MTKSGLPSAPTAAAIAVGFTIALDPRTRVWADGEVIAGGSPWRLSKLKPVAAALAQRLRMAGPTGLSLCSPEDLTVARLLLDRGVASPVVTSFDARVDVDVVVPILNHPEQLDQVLSHLTGLRVVVVDDGSSDAAAITRVAKHHGATVIRHDVNQGPAAARNTGMAATTSSFVAFIDADCLPPGDWIARLLPHFDDPTVAAVAPRVIAKGDGDSLIERYEITNSSLDMGPDPELVCPGGRVGYVPSAALIVRRSALGDGGFDPDLRLGEDVDLVWRLVESGWKVRYDPSVTVPHRTRTSVTDWARRKFDYGTSAPALEARHPGNLTPARPAAWNAATLALLASGHPIAAVATTCLAAGALYRKIATTPSAPRITLDVVTQGVVADAEAVGRLLRREWWPIGALVLLASVKVPAARVPAACMILPLGQEWVKRRPPLDPVRYVGLRMIDDAAYGTGVIQASLRQRQMRSLIPHVTGLPFIGSCTNLFRSMTRE